MPLPQYPTYQPKSNLYFSTQMSEIADLTYNVIAFSEIMQVIEMCVVS